MHKQLGASAALAWAFFGWHPSWLPHWEAQLKPTMFSDGPGLFAACVEAGALGSMLVHWRPEHKLALALLPAAAASCAPALLLTCVLPCLPAHAALNHTSADAAVAGKRALTALALVLARVQTGKASVPWHSWSGPAFAHVLLCGLVIPMQHPSCPQACNPHTSDTCPALHHVSSLAGQQRLPPNGHHAAGTDPCRQLDPHSRWGAHCCLP